VVDEPVSAFVVLEALNSSAQVSFDAPIRGELVVTRPGDLIEVHGELATEVTVPCCRCLTPVGEQLKVSVSLCYTQQADEGAEFEEEVEIEAAELGLVPFTGDEIELRGDLEQEIIMALPQHPLCDEGCKGLCPVCGANLNLAVCDCEPAVFHAGLAELKKFKIRKS
jgi:uncharacterized protein